MAAGRLCRSCSGRVIRSQYRETGRKQSFAETVGSPKSSTCWRTGSGPRVAKTSPGRSRSGRRLTWATAAAVTMFVAPGPMEVVHAIMRRRALALAKAMAAWAIACSLWARSVGSRSWTAWSASPRPATLPWPKIAHTPAKSGASPPSTSVRWAHRKRTSACAIVSRWVAIAVPPWPGPRRPTAASGAC